MDKRYTRTHRNRDVDLTSLIKFFTVCKQFGRRWCRCWGIPRVVTTTAGPHGKSRGISSTDAARRTQITSSREHVINFQIGRVNEAGLKKTYKSSISSVRIDSWTPPSDVTRNSLMEFPYGIPHGISPWASLIGFSHGLPDRKSVV